MARTIPLDFDTSLASGSPADRVRQVEAEVAAVVDVLVAEGARVVLDRSPRGGRHVWVPLAAPAARAELEPVLRALQRQFPTLDLKPALNVAAGCLRPPGARHPDGGHQELLTSLSDAVEAVRRRSAPDLLSRLRGRLADTIAVLDAAANLARQGGIAPVDAHASTRPAGAIPLDAFHRAIAESGLWPADKRTASGAPWTASEARQSVLASAAARGFSLQQVAANIESGLWQGLAGLYARYRHNARAALVRDWRKALRYASNTPAPNASQVRAVSNSHTRGETPTHRGASGRGSRQEHRHIRRWAATWQEVSTDRWTGKSSYAVRAVLAALGRTAQLTGSRYIDVGCRSLTLSAGLLDHSTVAAVLKQLRQEPNSPIELLEAERGARGDLYELVLPPDYVDVWAARTLPTGNFPGVHPVFGEVGIPEWCVYEATAGAGAATAGDLAVAAGMSRGEAYKTLNTLAAYGLVTKVGTLWRRTRLRLNALARRLATPSTVSARLARYRVERAAWRIVLDTARRTSRCDLAAAIGPDEPILWPAVIEDPPAEDDVLTPLQLLAEVLGAVPLTSGWLTVLDPTPGYSALASRAL